ncbi:MAG: pectin acetylesterase-family hydrolase [Acidobacteriota bacterium]
MSKSKPSVRLTPLAGLGLALALACLALACQPSADVAEEPATPDLLAELGEGWNAIVPGGETTCSDGSEYRFFARKGDPEKLLFYLQGGGGCWTAGTCDREGQPTYTTTAPPELRSPAGSDPEEGAMHGIMAFAHPDNPFADYSAVFVPYCTGDVHIGNRTGTYTVAAADEAPEREVTVEHKGFVNGQAALRWTYEAFSAPETVFVTGSSAGAIPSPVYARLLKDHYAGSRVVQLGDGAGGYRNIAENRPHEAWGTLAALSDFPEIAALSTEDFNFESLYTTSGAAEPEVVFSRYDTAEDSVQIQFLKIGSPEVEELQPLLDANEADIDAALATNYFSYVAPGTVHTILLRPEFYTYSVDGTDFRDWIAALAAGEPVTDVHCGECDGSPAPEAGGATAGG